MLSIPNLVPGNVSQQSSSEVSTRESETGEFDFNEYLLGHQISNPSQTTLDPAAENLVADAETALMSVFENPQNNGQFTLQGPGNPVNNGEDSIQALENALLQKLSSANQELGMLASEQAGEGEETLQLDALREFVLDRYSEVAEAGETQINDLNVNGSNQFALAENSTLDLSGAVKVPEGEQVSSSSELKPAQDLFNNVQALVERGGGKMKVSLNPPHLGQMEIEVSTRGKRVEVEMTSENEQAKTILESQLGDLKKSLLSQDLTLSKLEVNIGSGTDFLPFTGTENPFASLDSGNFSGGDSSDAFGSSFHNDSSVSQAHESLNSFSARSGLVSEGRVDVRI